MIIPSPPPHYHTSPSHTTILPPHQHTQAPLLLLLLLTVTHKHPSSSSPSHTSTSPPSHTSTSPPPPHHTQAPLLLLPITNRHPSTFFSSYLLSCGFGELLLYQLHKLAANHLLLFLLVKHCPQERLQCQFPGCVCGEVREVREGKEEREGKEGKEKRGERGEGEGKESCEGDRRMPTVSTNSPLISSHCCT